VVKRNSYGGGSFVGLWCKFLISELAHFLALGKGKDKPYTKKD